MKPRGKQSGFIQVAQDAEISLLSDRLKLVGFLRARGRPASSARGTSSIANVALDTLEANGVAISNELSAIVQSAVASIESGDELAQCTSSACVFLLYWGRPGSEEDVAR